MVQPTAGNTLLRLKFCAKSGPITRLRAGNPARCLSRLRDSAFRKPLRIEVSKGSDARATIILTSRVSCRISALFSLQVLRSLWVLVHAFVLLFLLLFRGRRWMVAVAAFGSQDKDTDKDEKGAERKGAMVRVSSTMVARKCTADQDVAARRAIPMRRVMQDDVAVPCAQFGIAICCAFTGSIYRWSCSRFVLGVSPADLLLLGIYSFLIYEKFVICSAAVLICWFVIFGVASDCDLY